VSECFKSEVICLLAPAPSSTNIKSVILQSVDKLWSEASDEIKQEYGEDYASKLVSTPWPPMDPPELIIDVLQSKVINKYPAVRTRVGKLAQITYLLSILLPTSVHDFMLSLGIRSSQLPAVLLKKK